MSTCRAWVSQPPHYTYGNRCDATAKYLTSGNLLVCGTHKRVWDRWVDEGRDLDSMIEFHWRLKRVRTDSDGES